MHTHCAIEVANRRPIEERLHETPAKDPNEYTKSKRRTEWIVAESGLPFLIMRPSAVIGDSLDGAYDGPAYGVYQFWTGMCRFLCDVRRPVIHAIAPVVPISVVHQDAVAAGFLAALKSAPNGTAMHLASTDATLPTTREMWQLWLERCGRPDEVRYYDRPADVSRDALDTGQRTLFDFAEANIEISSRHWHFVTGVLDRLRARGLRFADVTPSSFAVCLETFLRKDSRALAFAQQALARPRMQTVVVRPGLSS